VRKSAAKPGCVRHTVGLATMQQAPTPGGARILLVDVPDQVEMYGLGLESAGFTVTGVQSGADAVRLARAMRPDAIVVEVRLPDISGWDVGALLAADPRTQHIPIVLLTATVTPTLARDAAKAGCAACLVKPCYPNDLAAALRTVLSRGADTVGSSGPA
jgi:CheY-like chemotaxis protein